MCDSPKTTARSLRIRPQEVLRRLEAGASIRFLDVRGQKSLASTSLQILGSMRINAVLLRIDPAWDVEQLTVVYCT